MNQVKKNSRRAFVELPTASPAAARKGLSKGRNPYRKRHHGPGGSGPRVGCGICARECPATVITIREAAL